MRQDLVENRRNYWAGVSTDVTGDVWRVTAHNDVIVLLAWQWVGVMALTSYCFAYQNAVDTGFLNYVLAIVRDRQHLFQANENNAAARKFLKLTNVVHGGDDMLFAVKQRLAEYYGLGNYVIPPNLKDFIGYITEGGSIHPHKDPDMRGRMHVRINILISQSAGCIPLIEGIPIAVSVGDAWLNLASRCMHATTAVEGPGYRSALSFGYQIDPRRGEELYDIHKRWLSDIRQAA